MTQDVDVVERLRVAAYAALTPPPATACCGLLRAPTLARLNEVRMALSVAENIFSLYKTTEPP